MADPLFRVANGAYFVAFIGLAIALVALHERLAPRYGRYGLIAFLAALVGTMTQGGNMWFDGFAAPWLAEVAPQVFDAEKTITLVVGALAAYLRSPWAGCCSGSPCCAPASCRSRCRWAWSSAVCSGSSPACRRSASRSAWPSPRWAPR